LVATSIAARAEAPADKAAWMSDADLGRVFGGAEIDGHYASGRTFAENYKASGRLEYREASRSSGGRWSVQSGTFCTIYDGDTSGGCYRVKQVGQNCFEFYFVARTEERARVSPNRPSWTARAWLRTRPVTCGEGASV